MLKTVLRFENIASCRIKVIRLIDIGEQTLQM